MANPKQLDLPLGWQGQSMRVPNALALTYRRLVAKTRAAPAAVARTKFDFRPGPFRKGDVSSASLLLTPRLSKAARLPRRQYNGNVKEVPNGRK